MQEKGTPTSREALDALVQVVLDQVIAWPQARDRLIERMALDPPVAHEMALAVEKSEAWRAMVQRLCQDHPDEMATLVEEYARRALDVVQGVSRPWEDAEHPGSLALLGRVFAGFGEGLE